MQTDLEKRDEIIRFLRWASTHQKMWRIICSDDTSEPEKCLEIIQELESNEFYLLIPVLLERNKINYSMDKALYDLVLNKLADDWERKSISAIINELKEAMQQSQNHLSEGV